MLPDTIFPENLSGVVKELAAAAAHRATALKLEAEAAEQVMRTWKALDDFLVQDWPFHVLSLLSREKALLSQLRAEQHPAVQALDELARIALEQAEVIRRRFPAYIEEASRSNHLPLDQDSRHPQYRFEQGFFHLDVDDYRGVARLSDYETQIDEVPADVGAIVELVRREHKRVFGRESDPERFLGRVRQEYLSVLKKEKWPEGFAVPIRHITRRMGKNIKGFRTDEFLIDLSRLVDQGPHVIDGYRLDLQHTKDTSQGMLLHGPSGRGYIGFITFRRAENG